MIEVTDEMVRAARKVCSDYDGDPLTPATAKRAIEAALRAQPPQPTGDVGEDAALIQEHIDWLTGQDATGWGPRRFKLAAALRSMNSRLKLPAWPHSLHELEHSTAADPKGLVMYFNTEQEADAFSLWMARAALSPTEPAGREDGR